MEEIFYIRLCLLIMDVRAVDMIDLKNVVFKELRTFKPVQMNYNISCIWKKSDPSAYFLIGTRSTDESCHASRFRIFEGNSSQGVLRYDGNCLSSNETWVSASHMLFLDAWNLTYLVWLLLAKDQSNGACFNASYPISQVAEKEEKFITSANFPYLYPAMVECTWHIKSSRKSKIMLTLYFLDVEVGPTDQCVFDYIQIISDNRTERLCGENDWSKKMYVGYSFSIDFKSDFSGRRTGFLIGYSEILHTYTIL